MGLYTLLGILFLLLIRRELETGPAEHSALHPVEAR
jgi:hypothetical protein